MSVKKSIYVNIATIIRVYICVHQPCGGW